MIYVQVQNKEGFKFYTGESNTLTWHLGEDNIELRDTNFPVMRVLSVQADGDELSAIRRELTGIPNQNFGQYSTVLKWFGDDAQFIVANFIIPRVEKVYQLKCLRR